jgi:hypothetical protein
MFNIFLAVFFATLAFAFVEPFFFIGYLISIAIFGLYQAIFMANAGGAWDNAKKVVEVDLKQKGTPLHDATVIGDTVGDPFKDTSSVALNPVIKFTTLFGLLAVEISVGPQQLAAGVDAHGVALGVAGDEYGLRAGALLRPGNEGSLLREVLLHRGAAADPAVPLQSLAGGFVVSVRQDSAERLAIDLSVDGRGHVTDDPRLPHGYSPLSSLLILKEARWDVKRGPATAARDSEEIRKPLARRPIGSRERW